MKAIDRTRIAREFGEAVNMTAEELRDWLASDMSRAVGWKGADGSRPESVGYASGRHILSILLKCGRNLADEDFVQMRRTVGFIRRHLAQEPVNPVTSRWRYSLMNWGHDPLKAATGHEDDADQARQPGYGAAGSPLSRRMITMSFQPTGKHGLRRMMVAIGGLCLVAITLSACSVLSSKHPVGNPSVPEPAKMVDVDRYLGRWHEIARYDQSFQKGCEAVTADYSLRADGGIDVVNRCRKPDGTLSQARGRAKIVSQSGAKLKVSFFGPFYGDYWVLDRAEDYSWSIVGEPSGRYLWLLARDATPAAPVVQKLVGRAQSLGYDTSLLRYTRQP